MLHGTCELCRARHAQLASFTVLSSGPARERRHFVCLPCFYQRIKISEARRQALKDLQDSHLEDVEQTDLFDVC